jgi:glycosyltransferase involved in cell wall biosynthesis
MKAALITLSGDPDMARRRLQEQFENIVVENVPRSLIETGNLIQRLIALRRVRPEIFCIMTEALSSQYGQDALMVFGALSGARRSLILDSRGSIRSAARSSLLLFGPFRIVRTILSGMFAVRRATRKLGWLEREVEGNVQHDERPKAGGPHVSIAYLRDSPAAGTLPGGATSHINGVVNALVDLGADLTFISNDKIACLDKSKFTSEIVGTDTAVMPRAAFDIHNGALFSETAMQIVLQKRPDFIYQRYSRFSYAGVEASVRTSIPLFLEYNGSEVWVGRQWDNTKELHLLERYEKLNLATATRIFVVSDVERKNLLNAGISAEKIVVNPNGVDTEEFRPCIGGEAEREKLGFTPGETVAGFVGTFGPWHGVVELAEAIAILPREAAVRFLLVGDGRLRAEVEKKLRDKNVLDRVVFTGLVAHDRVPALLDACDILVSPHVPLADGSEFFGSPTKLFEYMAMCKPIVASRLGQIGDVIEHDKTGLLVEPANPAQLADAIQRLAVSRELRIKLGTSARREVEQSYTWKQNAARILDAYVSLLRDA